MLQTDWLKVGTAGRTVDGREIKGDLLERMAALYSPRVYTAGVNAEHFFYPGLGHVTALKVGKDELDRVALYARLAPTSELLARYQNKRQLFFSMEVRADFPAKGDFYLTGLAITDIPASQGLEPTRYAAGEAGLERYFDTACLEDREVAFTPLSPDEPPGWWSALWGSIRPHFSGKPHDQQTEQEAMTSEEREAFEAIQQEVAGLKSELATVAGRFAAEAEVEPESNPVEEAIGRFAEEVEAKINAALQPLNERLDRLDGYMAEPVEGEQGEVTGPVASGEPFVF